MGRRMVIAGACVLFVTLLVVTRSALAPRWDSGMNNIHYAAYSDGPQLVLCARGMTGNAFLNVLDRLGVFQINDNDVSECVYFEFESAPVPDTYSLKGAGQLVTSGRGEPHPFAFQMSSALNAAWFERTCFCPETETTVPFDGELIIESISPPRGRLQLSANDIVIDAELSSFVWEPLTELRERERFQRMLTR